jgi:hypothetical protein
VQISIANQGPVDTSPSERQTTAAICKSHVSSCLCQTTCTSIHACAIGIMLPELKRVGSIAFDRVRIVYMIPGRTNMKLRYTRSRGRRPWPASALIIWNMSNSACLHTIEHTKLSYRSQHDKSSKAFQIKFTCICIPAESSANGISSVAQFVTRPASRVMNPSSRRMC